MKGAGVFVMGVGVGLVSAMRTSKKSKRVRRSWHTFKVCIAYIVEQKISIFGQVNYKDTLVYMIYTSTTTIYSSLIEAVYKNSTRSFSQPPIPTTCTLHSLYSSLKLHPPNPVPLHTSQDA